MRTISEAYADDGFVSYFVGIFYDIDIKLCCYFNFK